jgi:hypothetical protein
MLPLNSCTRGLSRAGAGWRAAEAFPVARRWAGDPLSVTDMPPCAGGRRGWSGVMAGESRRERFGVQCRHGTRQCA